MSTTSPEKRVFTHPIRSLHVVANTQLATGGWHEREAGEALDGFDFAVLQISQSKEAVCTWLEWYEQDNIRADSIVWHFQSPIFTTFVRVCIVLQGYPLRRPYNAVLIPETSDLFGFASDLFVSPLFVFLFDNETTCSFVMSTKLVVH